MIMNKQINNGSNIIQHRVSNKKFLNDSYNKYNVAQQIVQTIL